MWLIAISVLSSVGTSSASVASERVKPESVGAQSPSVTRVVVTGSRRAERQSEAAVRTEVLSRRDVELSGAEELAELLQEVPGLQITQSFAGAGIQLRGLDPQHTLIILDGQRVNGRVDGTFDLGRIPAERIERVEIVKGPASALYGSDALAGVVHIITRDPEPGIEASAHLAVGSLEDGSRSLVDPQGPNTFDASARLAAAGPKWRGGLTGGFHHRGAYDLAPEDAATTGSQLESWDLEAHGSVDLSSSLRLRLRADVFQRRQQGVELGPQVQADDNPFREPGTRARYDRSNQTTTWSVTGGPAWEVAPGHDLRVDLSFSRFEDDFVRDQAGDDVSDLNQTTVDDLAQLTAQYAGSLGAEHELTAGFETLYEGVSSERLRTGEGTRARAGFYAQYQWTYAERLKVVPGIRLDLDSQFGAYPAPKLSVRYAPVEELAFRASYGLGFRAPSVRELYLIFENPGAGYVVEGNPDLRPETSRGLTAALDLRFEPRPIQAIEFTAEFFRNDVDDLIAFLPSGASTSAGLFFTNDNIEAAVTQGVETLATVRWTPELETEVGYMFLDSADLLRDRPLPGRSPHRVTFRARLDHRRWGLSGWIRGAWNDTAFQYLDGADGDVTTLEVPAYATLDLRIEKTVGRHVALFAGADNLLDAGDPQLLPIIPRSIYAGINGTY